VRFARNKQVVSDVPYNPYPTRTEWTGNNNSRLSLSQYIDGSHPVDLYETNGADSNRDHKTAQIPAAMRGKEQQGIDSKGNSHYWATEGAARQSGWSNEINPWTQKLDFRSGDDMQKSKSTYTSLVQLGDNEADKSFVPAMLESRSVTAEQAAFEKAKVADVWARNNATVDATNAFKDAVNLNTKESRYNFSTYY
jgi:hypothetical protein